MSKRLFIGLDQNGKAKIRQSRPSKDAETGHIGEMIFDADAVPLLRVGYGAFQAGQYLTFNNGVPPIFSVNHNLTRTPDLVVVMARAMDASNNPTYWGHPYFRRPNFGNPTLQTVLLGVGAAPASNMIGQWILPYIWNSSGGDVFNQDYEYGGFSSSHDSQKVYVSSQFAQYPSMNGYLECKWAAYRFT